MTQRQNPMKTADDIAAEIYHCLGIADNEGQTHFIFHFDYGTTTAAVENNIVEIQQIDGATGQTRNFTVTVEEQKN